MANDEQPTEAPPTDYPEAWGHRPLAASALGAAVDVYVSTLDDDEFDALVARTRQGSR
jgi:hypothetical protein